MVSENLSKSIIRQTSIINNKTWYRKFTRVPHFSFNSEEIRIREKNNLLICYVLHILSPQHES